MCDTRVVVTRPPGGMGFLAIHEARARPKKKKPKRRLRKRRMY